MDHTIMGRIIYQMIFLLLLGLLICHLLMVVCLSSILDSWYASVEILQEQESYYYLSIYIICLPLILLQVTCIPPGALVVASSEKTEVEMFAVGDNVLGIQCHPEFSKDVMMDIINRRLSGNMITSEVAKAAIESFEGIQPDQEPLKALCKAFLKGHPGVE
ncbi:PREDICTED: gamma-glutamyl peptidase 3-like [Nelumbo nucifera]|uniref:Gamma-glutamyl peptidase 3-like n=1 Tax=Nelumbo nucifera TaxID=4432 RepID=A0A1U7Z636_NELNU|nr:PREDICTED: gamma-glutamyl peptidase 3-like [Nelumbo nucifera]